MLRTPHQNMPLTRLRSCAATCERRCRMGSRDLDWQNAPPACGLVRGKTDPCTIARSPSPQAAWRKDSALWPRSSRSRSKPQPRQKPRQKPGCQMSWPCWARKSAARAGRGVGWCLVGRCICSCLAAKQPRHASSRACCGALFLFGKLVQNCSSAILALVLRLACGLALG